MHRNNKKKKQAVDPIKPAILIPNTIVALDQPGQIWRFGTAKSEDGEIPIYVTGGDWRRVCIQGLVATIGKAMGLPIPTCYMVLCNNESFPEIATHNGNIAFGIQAGPHPTLAAFAYKLNFASEILLKSKKETTNKLIVLDEWAGNGMRDETAAMIDPAFGLLLPDHHPSLPEGMNPSDQLRNWVFDLANKEINELDQRRLKSQMESSADNIFGIDLGMLADQPIWGGKAEKHLWLTLLDQLDQRRHHLQNLFCQRLGIPEQPLALHP